MYKRVLLKLSGEALAGDGEAPFDNNIISEIVSQIKFIIKKGGQVSLVIGGGNFWRGRSAYLCGLCGGFYKTKMTFICCYDALYYRNNDGTFFKRFGS